LFNYGIQTGIMKCYTLLALSAAMATTSTSAFMVSPNRAMTRAGLAMAQVPLVPEPEGGEEMMALSTMEGTRIKKMDEVTGVSSEDGAPVYNFWLNTIANGELIKEYKVTMLKESKKKVRWRK